MKRRLTKDGYFPKAGREYELVEFDEYVSVLNPKRFWTLSEIPNTYSLLDGEEVVGALGEGKLTLWEEVFIAHLWKVYAYRSGNIFSHMALVRPEEKVPCFLLDRFPLHDYKTRFEGLTYVKSSLDAVIWSDHKCFFISDKHGAILGQFLSEARVATEVPRAKGRIHVLASLSGRERSEIVGALFAVSTVSVRGLIDEVGF